MAPRSSLYRLVNERLDGQLPRKLGELRGEGRAWSEIAMVLYAEDRLRVSAETLRVWARQLGIANDDGAAA